MRLRRLFLAGLLLPLHDPSLFHQIHFKKIPQHQVDAEESALRIQVNSSASPLIYPLPQPIQVTRLKVQAELQGPPPNLKNRAEGSKGADDFALRVGLIVQGEKRLSWLQRQVAPHWLKSLERLLPKGLGVSRVEFITTCQDPSRLQRPLPHALDRHLVERCVLVQKEPGPFVLEFTWPESLPTLGIWIGPDGDDSASKFTVRIKKIELNHK